MEETRSMHDRHDKYIKFSSWALQKGNDLRDLGEKGKELIKQISKKLANGVGSILLRTWVIHTFLRL